MKKSLSLDSVQLTSDSSDSDSSEYYYNYNNNNHHHHHHHGSRKFSPSTPINPMSTSLNEFVASSRKHNTSSLFDVDESTTTNSDTLSVYQSVPLYLPPTASEKERREVLQLKKRRLFRSPRPNEIRNKTTEKLVKFGYSMRKDNIKRQIKEIAKHPGKTIENIHAKDVKKSVKSFFRHLPHFIVYFFVILIYFRDVVLNFFRFSRWPTIIFLPFIIILGIQIHAWIIWFKEILNIVIFYNILISVIFGSIVLYFGDWILVHLFPKLTASVLDGHILETTLARFYSVPVSFSFDIPQFSLMPFYNKVTPIHIKKQRLKLESSLAPITKSDVFLDVKEEDKDPTLVKYKRKLLNEKQNQYPFDLFRKIGKYVQLEKQGKLKGEEGILEKLEKLAERGMRDLDDSDYGSDLLKQITPYRDWFPLQKNCKVTLYQDAQGGFNGRNCFSDMYDAMENAKQIIYITGWSLNPNIRLKRDSDDPKESRTLGELLIDKANEGISVFLILWNETGSNIASNMDTGDGEAINYFRNTRVVAILSRRSGYSGLVFSHHQKTLICDKYVPEKKKRSIVAFVGGLDLTKGRYDSPSHSLFSTLETYHKDEVYSSRPLENKKLGPRQPWHDIHAMIEGKCAYDILQNFEERWTTQLGYVSLPKRPTYVENFKENPWCVQVFRSCDSDSIRPFTNSYTVFPRIQEAYISLIQKAQRFIYIENQYFCGSAFLWSNRLDAQTMNNRIPHELLEKIHEKIQSNEPFTVFVVIVSSFSLIFLLTFKFN